MYRYSPAVCIFINFQTAKVAKICLRVGSHFLLCLSVELLNYSSFQALLWILNMHHSPSLFAFLLV